jgi:ABC-type multidrug transport system fused ATPase/permease subunit
MLLARLVTALVYGLGGTLVIHGVFQVGTLVAFIALVSQLYGPLNIASGLPLEILTALVSFDRAFEIHDLEPLITERPAAHPLTQCPVTNKSARCTPFVLSGFLGCCALWCMAGVIHGVRQFLSGWRARW